MDLYAIFKRGINRHQCGGIFSGLDLAVATARTLLRGERDDYHDYEIVGFKLNATTQQTENGILLEPPRIVLLKRQGAKLLQS